MSLKFVPKVRINNVPSFVQIMAWSRPGDKPLSEPMMVSLLTHICVIRPQWVKETPPYSYSPRNCSWICTKWVITGFWMMIWCQISSNHLINFFLVIRVRWCNSISNVFESDGSLWVKQMNKFIFGLWLFFKLFFFFFFFFWGGGGGFIHGKAIYVYTIYASYSIFVLCGYFFSYLS